MRLKKFFRRNKSTIFTVISCAGVVVTAWLSYRAGAKCNETLRKQPCDTIKDEMRITGKYYIPPLVSISTTIGCIIYAHSVDQKTIGTLLGLTTVNSLTAHIPRNQSTIPSNVSIETIKCVVIDPDGTLFHDRYSDIYFRMDPDQYVEVLQDAREIISCSIPMYSLYDLYSDFGFSSHDIPEAYDLIGWDYDTQVSITGDPGVNVLTAEIKVDGNDIYEYDYEIRPYNLYNDEFMYSIKEVS